MTRTAQVGWTRRIITFAAGLALLGGLFGLLVLGHPLPGPMDDFIQRNVREDIQATALFYMDLDRIQEIQANLDEAEFLGEIQEKIEETDEGHL